MRACKPMPEADGINPICEIAGHADERTTQFQITSKYMDNLACVQYAIPYRTPAFISIYHMHRHSQVLTIRSPLLFRELQLRDD